jgi:hypothetical protein
MKRVLWRWGWCARGGAVGRKRLIFLVFDVIVMADEKKVGSKEVHPGGNGDVILLERCR